MMAVMERNKKPLSDPSSAGLFADLIYLITPLFSLEDPYQKATGVPRISPFSSLIQGIYSRIARTPNVP